MQEVKLEITNKYGEKLVGLKTIPAILKDKYPVVVLVHGFATGKNMESTFDGLLKNLIAEGFLVYRFDFSGCGESEGNYVETSLSKLKSDLGTIINFVKSQPEVDNSRIGILAQSTGTTVTVSLEPEVNCMVLTGSISHYKETMVNIFEKGYNPAGISIRTKANGTITKIGPQFWKDIAHHNLLESVKRIHCPILFIHGSKDEKVPISEMEAYFANVNEPKEKVIIEGANHNFDPHQEKLYKSAADWFNKYLAYKESSKIIIVDDHDNIIGSKEMEKASKNDIYRVSALWITNSQEEILIARRSLNKSHSPGKWGPAVAGTIEEGETYRTNIIKEAEEELGLKNINPQEGSKIRVSDEYNYFCQWYLLKSDKKKEEFVIQKEEVEEVKWISKKELMENMKNKPENFVEAIDSWMKNCYI